MKQKFLYFILSIFLLLSLASCDNKNNNENNNQNENQNDKPKEDEKKEDDKKEEIVTPTLPNDYYVNLLDETGAYKLDINKVFFTVKSENYSALLVHDSYVEYELNDDYDFEIYGDVKFDLLGKEAKNEYEVKAKNEYEVKFYLLNTEIYYMYADLTANKKMYNHFDVLEVEAASQYISQIDQVFNKYFGTTISNALNDKNMKKEFVDKSKETITKVLGTVLVFDIKEDITATFNFDALRKFNQSLKADTISTIVDNIFGPFTYINLKNQIVGSSVSKSIFDYKLKDFQTLEQFGAVSIDNIEETINSYLPKINLMLGEKKLPFNSVNELIRFVAAKLDIEVSEEITLREFLNLEALGNFTINEIINLMFDMNLDLKAIASQLFDLGYKYTPYQFINALATIKTIDELPAKIATAPNLGIEFTVDAVIEIIAKIDLKLVTDGQGNLKSATLKFLPDDFIFDFDFALNKTTFTNVDSFKQEVENNLVA